MFFLSYIEIFSETHHLCVQMLLVKFGHEDALEMLHKLRDKKTYVLSSHATLPLTSMTSEALQ